MNVFELTREQLAELKQNFLCERNDQNGKGTFYSELFDADSIISDDEIFERYADTYFVNDDFFCTACAY